MKKFTSDHRTRVTQMLLRKALTELLRRKPIQSISVKELSDLAGVHRGTFYSHYSDIYALRDEMEADMLTDFERALAPLLAEQPMQLTPVTITTEIFQCLKDNSELCVVTLGEYGDKEFARRLINMGREFCMQSYAKYFAGATPKKIEYFYAFASAGCIGLLEKWLADGMGTPARDIAEMAEAIMMQGIGYLKSETAR